MAINKIRDIIAEYSSLSFSIKEMETAIKSLKKNGKLKGADIDTGIPMVTLNRELQSLKARLEGFLSTRVTIVEGEYEGRGK